MRIQSLRMYCMVAASVVSIAVSAMMLKTIAVVEVNHHLNHPHHLVLPLKVQHHNSIHHVVVRIHGHPLLPLRVKVVVDLIMGQAQVISALDVFLP